MRAKQIQQLLKSQEKDIQSLHDIVMKSIEEEDLIMMNLKNKCVEQLSRAQQLTDSIAKFGGSWTFIISFCFILFVWILFNVLAITKYRFDPYPFILMNLVLSCLAALQAPIIMMSQNRMEEKDRQRAENDYIINLKSELEIRSLHQKIDLLLENEIKLLFESQAQQLDLLNSLRKEFIVRKENK